ncbi:MAG: hypothetical protein SGCHY_005370 [Lobulomycetales sp.]
MDNDTGQQASLGRIYRISSIACLGGFLFGYDSAIISGILVAPAFNARYGAQMPNGNYELSPGTAGDVASILQLGGFIGILFQPMFNDRLGRKQSLILLSLVFSVGAVVQAAAQTAAALYVGRFISGFCVSVLGISVSLYNTECAPSSIRGKIVGGQQVMVALGAIAAYALNYGLALTLDPMDFHLYTIPLGLQALPALLLGAGMLFMPPSPRWLISRGRGLEARAALAYIRCSSRESQQIDDELQGYSNALAADSNASWKRVFSPDNFPRLMVGVPLILFQQFVGMNTLNYFAPQVFRDLGVTGKSGDLLATGIIGLVKLFSVIPAVLYMDRVGRRKLFLYGTGGMAICLAYVGIFYELVQRGLLDVGGKDIWTSIIAIASIYIFVAFYSISWAPLHYIIPTEIFPQLIRGKCNSLTGAADWLGQYASIKIAPLILLLPGGLPFFLFVGLNCLFFAWGWVLLPETKGYRLEDIGELFKTWKRWRLLPAPPLPGCANPESRDSDQESF